jgi:RNA polymerase sigma-70 factor (ECF subfamily)
MRNEFAFGQAEEPVREPSDRLSGTSMTVLAPRIGPPTAPTSVVPVTRSGAGPTDAALVVAARAGEDWAREALFRRHAPMVAGMAFRLLGRDEDVDDLVQDSFVEALRSLDRLQAPQAFASWLASIVVRTSSKVIRRRRLLTRLGLRRGDGGVDVDAVVSPSAPPDVATELRALYARIEALPARERVALVLRRVEGLGIDEIAALVGASPATVKRRVAEAEQLLAKFTQSTPEEIQEPKSVRRLREKGADPHRRMGAR